MFVPLLEEKQSDDPVANGTENGILASKFQM